MARYLGYKKPKDLKRTMRHLTHYLGGHKWMFLLVALLVLISTGANILGTYLLKPVINRFILPGDVKGLLTAVAGMGILYLCGVAATFGYNQLMVMTAQKVIKEIRHDLFAHVQKLPLKYFDAHTHGELMSRFTNDVDTVQEAMNSSFAMLIQSFLMLVGTISMMLVLSVRLTLIVVVFLLLMAAFIKFNGSRSRKYFTRQQEEIGKINGFVEEMAAGQKVEKVFNHEKVDFKKFCELNETLRRESTNALTFAGMMIPTIVSLSFVNYAVSACVGGLFALSGLLDIGSLSSYLVYVRQSAMPMNQFTQQVNFLLAALSGAERIFQMMEEEPEIDEGMVTLSNVKEENGILTECEEKTGIYAWKEQRDGRTVLTPLTGDVRFENVVFSYVKGKTILNGISLYAKPGQKIAFVGSTGAGKTTIVNLLMRFYDLNAGHILLDGTDCASLSREEVRSQFAMVLQDTWLFRGTIAENVSYGTPGATREQIVEACDRAYCDHFIRTLPQGYDTVVGDDMTNLSGGQKQLLTIARAMLANRRLLILDEATSNVDTRTEILLQKAMDRLMKGRTCFVIAHRLSTIVDSDLILVLDHGHIVEQGTHTELLARRGFYYQLYTSQYAI